MPGHVEFGYDSNTSIASVVDDLASLRLRVIQPVRSHLMQLWELAAFDAESLVFSQMPVQHVQLHSRHTVELALDHFYRLKMPTDVDQQSAPGESRPVLYADCRNEVSVAISFNQLL